MKQKKIKKNSLNLKLVTHLDGHLDGHFAYLKTLDFYFKRLLLVLAVR